MTVYNKICLFLVYLRILCNIKNTWWNLQDRWRPLKTFYFLSQNSIIVLEDLYLPCQEKPQFIFHPFILYNKTLQPQPQIYLFGHKVFPLSIISMHECMNIYEIAVKVIKLNFLCMLKQKQPKKEKPPKKPTRKKEKEKPEGKTTLFTDGFYPYIEKCYQQYLGLLTMSCAVTAPMQQI